MQVSNETKVGALAAISITVLILGYNFLKGNQMFTSKLTVYAVYEDISGLNTSDPVLINGLSVGNVSNMRHMPGQSGHILVEMALVTHINVPEDSEAKLINSDLLGTKAISIIRGSGDKAASSGDTLRSGAESDLAETVREEIAPVKAKTEKLLDQIDTVLTVVQYFLNEETRKNFWDSFDNLERTIQNFARTSARLDTLVASQSATFIDIFQNVESITTNLKNNNEAITKLLNNLAEISDSADIVATINNSRDALDHFSSVLDKINKGEGSLGLLVNDQKLYNELANSAKSLDVLLKDLEENPSRYVHFSIFGKSGKDKRKNKDKKD